MAIDQAHSFDFLKKTAKEYLREMEDNTEKNDLRKRDMDMKERNVYLDILVKIEVIETVLSASTALSYLKDIY